MKLMRYFKQMGLSILILLLAWSCAERNICPAYQSAFIHDKDVLRKHFSYFKEDSTPKLLTASKNKFLIAERQPYWKKVRSLNTVEMETVYPQLDDSTQLAGDVALLAEMDVVDSVALDSAVVNEIGWTEHFNVEQEFYFYYFNDILVYPEERALMAQERENKKKNKAGKSNEKEGKQNFFQKFLSIFKKKPKPDEDATTELAEDEDASEEGVDDPPKKKKKKKKGKKKKNKQSTEEKELDEEAPEEGADDEDDDDDF